MVAFGLEVLVGEYSLGCFWIWQLGEPFRTKPGLVQTECGMGCSRSRIPVRTIHVVMEGYIVVGELLNLFFSYGSAKVY